MLERLTHLDRRWLFLAMGIAIVVPLLLPVSLSFRVSPMVRSIYDEIEKMPPGTTVFMSVDYDPSSKPEIDPFTRAVIRHLLRKRARIVFATLWETGVPIVQGLMAELIEGEYAHGTGYFADKPHPPYVYGRDYVFLGYKAGKEQTIAALGQNIAQLFPTESRGTPLARLPIMEGKTSLRDFALVLNPSSGFPGSKEYVRQVVARLNLRFASATTAVSLTDLTPYYPEQIFGLVGGMRGAAEYEQLVGYPGTATAGLNVLTFGQMLVIAAIVLGNLVYFLQRARTRGRH